MHMGDLNLLGSREDLLVKSKTGYQLQTSELERENVHLGRYVFLMGFLRGEKVQ